MQRFAGLILVLTIALPQAWLAHAQDAKTPYPTMAPLNQYLISDQSAEIALARSAAPKSISDHAEILVLGQHGYETAVKGTNGFVCMVQRSWTTTTDDPGFWNPKARAPLCFNAPAAQTSLPIALMKTRLALAGKSTTEIHAAINTAFEQKKLPPIAPGAMCYMLSKQGYLNDHDGHWHPHLMFFRPLTKPEKWGANLPNSPLFAAEDTEDRMTVFMVPVAHWSDGTPDTNAQF